jgi:hypothetical protein
MSTLSEMAQDNDSYLAHKPAQCLVFLTTTWPKIELWLRQFVNGEKLGGSENIGRPCCKEAWVKSAGCFISKKQVMGPWQGDPAIVIELSIFPDPYQYEFDPRPIKPKE